MIDKLFDWIEKYFYTKLGLFLGIVLILFTIPFFLNTLKIINIWISISIYAFLITFWFIIWFYYQIKYPKTMKGLKGIYIAVDTENEIQKIRIKKDFISTIQKLLIQNNLDRNIQVHYLNEYQSKILISIISKYNSKKAEIDENEITNNEILKFKEITKYNKINKRLNASYYVWGEIKLRKEIKPKYFLSLHGLVNHKLTSKEISKRLTEEFSQAFISDCNFEESLEKPGFDFLAESNFITATYIIGIAALISNELELAYKLHKIVEQKLIGIENKYPNFSKAKMTIKDIMSEELFFLADFYLKKEKNLEVALKYNEENINSEKFKYNVFLQRTVIEFLLGNIDNSIKYNEQLKTIHNENNSWKYNRAFLLMCNGCYDEGYREYVQLNLISLKDDTEIVQQCIEFDKNILDEKPEYEVINFIIGYLYYEKLKNSAAALEYLENFLKSSNINIYPKNMIKKTNEIIQRIKIEIKISN